MSNNYQMDIKLANLRIQAHRRQAELIRLANEAKIHRRESGFRQRVITFRANFNLSYWLKRFLESSKQQAAKT